MSKIIAPNEKMPKWSEVLGMLFSIIIIIYVLLSAQSSLVVTLENNTCLDCYQPFIFDWRIIGVLFIIIFTVGFLLTPFSFTDEGDKNG